MDLSFVKPVDKQFQCNPTKDAMENLAVLVVLVKRLQMHLLKPCGTSPIPYRGMRNAECPYLPEINNQTQHICSENTFAAATAGVKAAPTHLPREAR